MFRFQYEAVNAEGQLVTGELEAVSVQQAAAQLESLGLTLRSIARAGTTPVTAEASETSDATTASIVPFSPLSEESLPQTQLQRLLRQAGDLLPALQAYAQDLPQSRERRELQTVVRIVEQGGTVEAVKSLRALPGYWIPLLSVAIQNQDSGLVLRGFMEESRRSQELRRQWWLTLVYPACLLALATAVLVGLSHIVVPVYRNLFEDFQIELPPLTKLVVAIAEGIVSGRVALFFLAIVVGLVLIWGASYLLPTRWREKLADAWSLRFRRGTALARFSRFAAELLETNLPMPEAVRLAGTAASNGPIRRAAWRLAAALEQGETAPPAPVDNLLTHTIQSALQSPLPLSTRATLLHEVSECYAQRTRNRLSWTRGIIEPLAICLVGAMVAITAIGLLLPLVSITTSLSG